MYQFAARELMSRFYLLWEKKGKAKLLTLLRGKRIAVAALHRSLNSGSLENKQDLNHKKDQVSSK
jgi:hypothetical protein